MLTQVRREGLCMTKSATVASSGDEHLLDLNRSCLCLPLDRSTLDAGITARTDVGGMREILSARSHLFAATPVFVSQRNVATMQAQIDAIEALAQLEGFQILALSRSSADLAHQANTRGLILGYDFHITAEGPRLIEVNTNAGGAFLMSSLQQILVDMAFGCGNAGFASRSSDRLNRVFTEEWRYAGRSGQPNTVAIVDDDPASHYLHPDVLLAREGLQRAGINVVVADSAELRYDGDALRHAGTRIDMVYNRLTDFDLSSPIHAPLCAALVDDAVLVSPAPRHHALYADKRNLTLFGDARLLQSWGLAPEHVQALAETPQTRSLTAANSAELWRRRRELFFKPAAGFGSRAAYRGDKLTRRVWREILRGRYVAQSIVTPGLRLIEQGGRPTALKYDIRVYTYAGSPLLLAARIYQGQTTNFRTPGGGFAPVLSFFE